MLKEAASGIPVADVTRKHGVSAATFYKRRAKYGGMATSDMARLRALERENARVKRMYADLSLEHQVAQEALAKSVVGPTQRVAVVRWAVSEHGVSERAACPKA